MAKRKRSKDRRFERENRFFTNELDSLLEHWKQRDQDNSPIHDLIKADLPLEVVDRRIKAPAPPSSSLKRALVARERPFKAPPSFVPIEKLRELVCTRRQERREVLHALFKNRGGVGSNRKFFKDPVRTVRSKIKC